MSEPIAAGSPRALAAELGSAGDLPAGFGSLLARVPRETFVPEQIWVDGEPVDRVCDPWSWYRAVYRDHTIVTQYDDGRTEWPTVGELPTCSASQPSVVLGMLDALDVQPGQDVLEIGTGTGYNAALLAELVGPAGSVTTVEIDPGLAAAARGRNSARQNVRTVVGDGTHGALEHGPYDRVICTMSVHLGRIPYAWVGQTRPGGLVLTPVRADLASGPLVRFTVREDRTAVGRMLPMGVGFMEHRQDRTAATADDEPDWSAAAVTRTAVATDPWLPFTDPTARWAVALAVPSCRYDLEKGRYLRLGDPLTGSWASVVPENGGQVARQCGIRRLWDEVHAAYTWWLAQGRPTGPDWLWTIAPDRQTCVLR